MLSLRFGVWCSLLLLASTVWTIQAVAQTAGAAASSADAAKGAQDAQKTTQEENGAAASAKRNAAQAAAGGVAVNASTNVKGNVDIQAVLLPRKQAERVFSKEISRHYAVIQVTIDNKSKQAAFVLQSIFADYSGWALSGFPNWQNAGGVPSSIGVSGATSTAGDTCPQATNVSRATDFQTIACAGQVASVESRIIRGELQDASAWTARNTVIRAAVLVGTVASGIPAFGSKNALKYVGAYNGQLVPGAEVFWPDGTITQLNRVSDFGFQTNKIISKETSDIVYAFFPLDRFLTPGMKEIFLNAPAVFFAPAQIFVDKHFGKVQGNVDEMKELIEKLAGMACPADKTVSAQYCSGGKISDEQMLALMTMECGATPEEKPSDEEQQACKLAKRVQNLISKVSLNSTNVSVQGVMTVDVAIVPATITDITFDEGNSSSDVWTILNKDHAATVTGTFLTGGVPTVPSIEVPNNPSAKISDYLDPTKVSVVSDGSTDTKLNFKIQWTKEIPSGSKLHFQVTKYDPKDTKKTSGIKSMDFVFPVDYVKQAAAGKPSISKISIDSGSASATWAAGSSLTGNVIGSGLAGATLSITAISVPSDKTAAVAQYIDASKLATDKSKTNDDGNLHFTLALQKVVPSGSTITFTASTSGAAGTATSDPKAYTVEYK